jgi:hypothetical protein
VSPRGVSSAALEKLAEQHGITVCDGSHGEVGCCEITLTAPDGFRFGLGLHELVVCDDEQTGAWHRQVAAAEIREFPLEECNDPACEWCNDK